MEWNVTKLLDDVRRDAISKVDEKADMQGIFEMITDIVRMGKVAREEGLLAVEEDFTAVGENRFTEVFEMKDLLPLGAMYMVDAYPPETIVEVLTNTYWTRGFQGNEALKQYIVIRGVLLVQEGESPWAIEHILKTLLPISVMNEFHAYMKEKREIWAKEHSERIKKAFEHRRRNLLKDLSDKMRLEETEKLIMSLDDRALQRVLREIDNYDLCMCMTAFSLVGCEKIFANTSERLALMLKEDILKMSSLSDQEIVEALQKVNRIIRRLEDMGEICNTKK